jgi:AraC family transcriptional regulator
MHPTRHATLDPATPLHALTATARGLQGRTFVRAAQQAYGELMAAVDQAGLLPQVRSCLSLSPDSPQGPDDPHCRYIAGVLFGHHLASGQGACMQPALPLSGSLAWHTLAPGRYAVFSHIGPYTTLWKTWRAIYQAWLPASGETLRSVPPLELSLTTPDTTPADELHTEIWIPVAGQ